MPLKFRRAPIADERYESAGVFAGADLRGAGRLDIVAAGKDGLYVFLNEGME